MLNESAASEEHVFQSVCLCVVFRNTTITTVFIISIIVYIYCKQFKVVGNLHFMPVVLLVCVCVCVCVCVWVWVGVRVFLQIETTVS